MRQICSLISVVSLPWNTLAMAEFFFKKIESSETAKCWWEFIVNNVRKNYVVKKYLSDNLL